MQINTRAINLDQLHLTEGGRHISLFAHRDTINVHANFPGGHVMYELTFDQLFQLVLLSQPVTTDANT